MTTATVVPGCGSGQAADAQPDEGSPDDRQFPVVALPSRRGWLAFGAAVPIASAGRRRSTCRTISGVASSPTDAGQDCWSASLSTAPCRARGPFAPGSRAGAGKYGTRSLHGQPQHPDGQRGQQPGQPGQVIPGVEDHQDVRVTLPAVTGNPGSEQQRPRGPHGRSPRWHHRRGPAGPRPAAASRTCGPAPAPPANEHGQPRMHKHVPLAARIGMAEQAVRAGLRIRPQPVAHVDRQPNPAIPAQAGNGSPASDRRSRPICTRPLFTASSSPRRGHGGTPAPATARPACGLRFRFRPPARPGMGARPAAPSMQRERPRAGKKTEPPAPRS